ncbi:MAG: hypothetical protein ACD_4C00402G0002 [uncultured bacterium (gcode 4)]|uniref:Uncharacterized protein n=1 Tax=uncultured bacterium (gcode 4) TaxID=1234023 RepID=K2FTH0_9BACT|nr:MAG: hypothetical protein ACD_4C00402G0002 [uncultured bacterium (gcode 4)]
MRNALEKHEFFSPLICLHKNVKESTNGLINNILSWNVKDDKIKSYYFEEIRKFRKIFVMRNVNIIENKLNSILRNDIFLFFIINNEFDISNFLDSGSVKEEWKSISAKLFCNSKDFFIWKKLCDLFKFSEKEVKSIVKKSIKNLVVSNFLNNNKSSVLESMNKISRLAEQFGISEEEINSFLKLLYLNKKFLKS